MKTTDKRLARVLSVIPREKSTLRMTKHQEHRRSENCFVSGRALKIQKIALELVFDAKH